VDDPMAQGYLQALLNSVPGSQGAGISRSPPHLSDLYGQVPLLHAGGGHFQRLAVFQQDDGQLAELRGEVAGQGAPDPGAGVRLV